MNRSIPFFSLQRQWQQVKEHTSKAMDEILETQHYVGGAAVCAFEEQLGAYLGKATVVSCNSGTDALWLALKALEVQPGDIVLTTPFSFIASSSEIVAHNAYPVFIDIDEDTYNLSPVKLQSWLEKNAKKVAQQTVHAQTGLPIKGLVVVNIFGQCADYDKLNEIAAQWGLWLIEDAAQSIGSSLGGKKSGTFGTISTFSFYPTKNLGAFGDAGATVTSDERLAKKLMQLRNHGRISHYEYHEKGINSRLDALQAAVLSAKLPLLEGWNERRRVIASFYEQALKHKVKTPTQKSGVHTYHQYCIEVEHGMRDALCAHLTAQGIGTNIFYPQSFTQIPFLNTDPRLVNPCPVAERLTMNILALPIWPELTDEEVAYVAENILTYEHRPSPQQPLMQAL